MTVALPVLLVAALAASAEPRRAPRSLDAMRSERRAALLRSGTPLAGHELERAVDAAVGERLGAEGLRLSSAEARALEERIARGVGDAADRFRLIAYHGAYRSGGDEAARLSSRVPHSLWLIEREPRSELSVLPENLPHGREDPLYARAGALWERLVAAHPEDPAVAGNAAEFLKPLDEARAERLFRRAQKLAPSGGRWRRGLGSLYLLMAKNAPGWEEERALDRKALSEFEAALPLVPEAERVGVLLSAAEAALGAGSFGKAQGFTLSVLSELAGGPGSGEAPKARERHLAYTTLGKLVFLRGDPRLAEDYLFKACRGGPGAAGPVDMDLVHALRGQDEALLERYLDACGARAKNP